MRETTYTTIDESIFTELFSYIRTVLRRTLPLSNGVLIPSFRGRVPLNIGHFACPETVLRKPCMTIVWVTTEADNSPRVTCCGEISKSTV